MALSVVFAGCFNPPPLITDPTGDPATGDPATDGPVLTETTDLTSLPTTTDAPPDTDVSGPSATTSTTDLDPTATTGPLVESTGPGECGSTTECPGGLCHPDDGHCVECLLNEHCKNPDLPHCDDNYACTACVGDADCSLLPNAPICDDTSHLCRPCDEHSDCPATACDLDVGTCFPPGATHHAYVDPNSCNSMMADSVCPEAMPCCQLSDAFADIVLNQQTYVVVHAKPGLYMSPVVFDRDDRKVALLAEPGAVLRTEQNTGPALLIGDPTGDKHVASSLFVRGLSVKGIESVAGVACLHVTGSLWFDDGSILDHGGPGLRARSCRTTARRTRITNNVSGVHADEAGLLLLRNTAVSGDHTLLAAQASGSGSLDILYSTIADRSPDPGHLLTCSALAPVAVRNSIVVTSTAHQLVINCPFTTEYSAFTTGSLPFLGPSNQFFPADTVSLLFVGWDFDELDLMGDENPLGNAGLWLTSDPRTDIHGKPRPTINATVDAIGIDIPGK